MPAAESQYYSDYRAEADDFLNFGDFIPTLADLTLNAETPLTVGIFGPWGSGKTSLLFKLRRAVDDKKINSYTAWFTAWKYERQESLWRAFILRVLDALYPRETGKGFPEDRTRLPYEELDDKQKSLIAELDLLQEIVYRPVDWQELGRWTADWGKLLEKGVDVGAEIASIFVPGAGLIKKAIEAMSGGDEKKEAIKREVKNFHLNQLLYIEQFEKTFSQVVKKAVGDEGRLIVFVDDLDRCLPEKAIEVLEAIKLFLEVQNVVFVLGMDKEVVERGIETRYKEWFLLDKGKVGADHERLDLPVTGEAYLQKMVQIPFHLPPLRDLEVEKYIEYLEQKLEFDQRLSPMTRKVLAKGLYPNPRQTKRIINILRVLQGFVFARQMRLVKDEGEQGLEISPALLAKTILIQQQYPDFYSAWREIPTLVKSLEEAYRQHPAEQARQIRRGELPKETDMEVAQLPKALAADELVPVQYRYGLLHDFLRDRRKYTLLEKLLCFPAVEEARESKEEGPFSFAALDGRHIETYLYLVSVAEAVQEPQKTSSAVESFQAGKAGFWDELLGGDAALITEAVDRIRQAGENELQVAQHNLLPVLADNRRAAKVRVSAGNALARLGDPRFDTQRWHLPADEFLPEEMRGMLGFVHIPAGEFEMGSDKQNDPQASEEESPRHPVSLPDYYLAHYPTTTAQFSLFVKQASHQLRYSGSLEGLPNHPVVNVTWHDALAYCRWLDKQLKALTPQMLAKNLDEKAVRFWQGLKDDNLGVTLPSEAEWEKAARGGKEVMRETGIYPWGDAFDPDKANTDESSIGGTSAVGCFPGGASPYGLLDMSGNVWEWTRSLWGKKSETPDYKYPYNPGDKKREDLTAGDDILRVLRGGSFYDLGRLARCAYRNWFDPHGGHRLIGFRVAVSPK